MSVTLGYDRTRKLVIQVLISLFAALAVLFALKVWQQASIPREVRFEQPIASSKLPSGSGEYLRIGESIRVAVPHFLDDIIVMIYVGTLGFWFFVLFSVNSVPTVLQSEFGVKITVFSTVLFLLSCTVAFLFALLFMHETENKSYSGMFCCESKDWKILTIQYSVGLIHILTIPLAYSGLVVFGGLAGYFFRGMDVNLLREENDDAEVRGSVAWLLNSVHVPFILLVVGYKYLYMALLNWPKVIGGQTLKWSAYEILEILPIGLVAIPFFLMLFWSMTCQHEKVKILNPLQEVKNIMDLPKFLIFRVRIASSNNSGERTEPNEKASKD